MARRTKSSASKQPESRKLTAEDLKKAVSQVGRRINDLEGFDVKTITERFDATTQALKDKINSTIADIFGHGTVEYNKYSIWSLDTLPLIIGAPEEPLPVVQEAYQKGISDVVTKLKSLKETLEEKLLDIEEEYGSAPQTYAAPNSFARVEQLLKRFHLIVKQLRDRHGNRQTLSVEDEYDVQDLMHALLFIDFEDIRTEEWTPSYAGSSSRMDFLLKNEQIVIETKKTRKGLGGKEIGEELIIDIEKYQNHLDCKTLVCFVYDPEGRIPNPRGIENDLNRTEGDLTVKVVIAPTGM